MAKKTNLMPHALTGRIAGRRPTTTVVESVPAPAGAARLAVVDAERVAAFEAENERLLAEVARLKATGDAVPAAVFHRIVRGENPITVWREHRNWTKAALAEAAGVSRSYLGSIEAGRKQIEAVSVGAIAAMAEALDCDIEDLLPARN